MTSKRIALLVLVIAACGRVSEESRSPENTANDLVGVWDATMSLAQPYPLQPDAPVTRQVCGTLGFVANHARVGGGAESIELMQIGVYDLALKRIGLEWNGEPAFPVAVATGGRGYDSASGRVAGDSVRIVVNPGSDERIVLIGRYDGGEIEGEWTAQSARGTAAGAFSMRPHSTGPHPRESCSS